MLRASINNAFAGVICFLLLDLVVLEIQRMDNAADCDRANAIQPMK